MSARKSLPARLAHALTLAALLVLATIASPFPFAQAARAQDSAGDSAALPGLLEQGMRLESERRWNDALTYYESAVRENPGQQELERRLDTVRVHLDVARRYADASFVAESRRLGLRESLGLYNEILTKIQTHYVQPPDWRTLYVHGLETFEAALEDPDFLACHRLTADERLAQFAREAGSQGRRYRIRDAREAYNAAAYCAQWAERDLGLPAATVLLEFTSGAVGALDEYSAFLTGSQLDEVFSQIEGNFVGLGVELKPEQQSLRIVHVIPGGPAADAGFRASDRITAVDGQVIGALSPEQAADMLKGVEGSAVQVTLESPDGSQRTLRLTRRRVEVPSVDAVQLIDTDNGIGYLRLTSFQKTTQRDVDEALWQLHRQGMRGLIIDLRGNPGGLLSAAVEVADKFLAQGAIVSTRGRSASEDYDYRARASGTWRLPLIVLIDGDSASASEIFAGAIHDQGRGLLVGERSFGKGSVQGIFPLTSARAGVRLTTAKFFSPSGQPISKRGVTPHVRVQTVARPTADGQVDLLTGDAVLRAGLQAAREQVAQR